MPRLSRAVYVLFVLSATLFLVLARPVTDSQLEKTTTNAGQGTWFDPGLGACGYTDSASDPIVAISSSRFGSGGNCNQWIKITNTDNGKSTYGKTRDSCPGCDSGDLDMSPIVFKKIANLNTGVIPIKWGFQPKGWAP